MISIKFKEKRKMQISKSKTAAIAIAIFLTFSMGASLMLVPSASAHSPSWNIPTFAYINAAPDPVGLGQKVYIIMWIDDTYDPASALSTIIDSKTTSSLLLRLTAQKQHRISCCLRSNIISGLYPHS